ATATIRQAENAQQIQRVVEDQIGWEMRILSEQEEAYYGFLAVVNSTSIQEGITVDIGGGSTEVTYFKDRSLVESHSFSFGALTLKEFFSSNKSVAKSLTELRQYVTNQLSTLPWLAGKN